MALPFPSLSGVKRIPRKRICSMCQIKGRKGGSKWSAAAFGHELLCEWCFLLLDSATGKASYESIRQNIRQYADPSSIAEHVNAVRREVNARNGWTSKNRLALFRFSRPSSLPNLEGRSERDREFLGPG